MSSKVIAISRNVRVFSNISGTFSSGFNSRNRQVFLSPVAYNAVSSVRTVSKIPTPDTKEVIKTTEKVFFKALAKGVYVARKIRNSDEYHATKKFAINTFFWIIRTIQKHVIEHPKVLASTETFKKKFDDALREEYLKK